MKRTWPLLSLVAGLFLASCGGGSNDNGINYYVIVEGSSIGEQQIGGQMLGALVSEPVIDTGSKRVNLTTRHGAWLTESVQHFSDGHQYPTVEIIGAVANGPGELRIVSNRVFQGAAIQSLTIRSKGNDDAADYEFSFIDEVDGSREGSSIPRSAPFLRAAAPNNRFLQIQGFQGDATVPGLEGAIILSSYSVHLFGTGDTQMKATRLTVTSPNIGLFTPFTAFVEEKANSGGFNTFFSFALSHYSTNTGLLALRYFASDAGTANLNLTSDDDGDEFTFDVVPLFYLVSESERYDASGQRTETVACVLGTEDAQKTCPPKPDFFTEQGSVPVS